MNYNDNLQKVEVGGIVFGVEYDDESCEVYWLGNLDEDNCDAVIDSVIEEKLEKLVGKCKIERLRIEYKYCSADNISLKNLKSRVYIVNKDTKSINKDNCNDVMILCKGNTKHIRASNTYLSIDARNKSKIDEMELYKCHGGEVRMTSVDTERVLIKECGVIGVWLSGGKHRYVDIRFNNGVVKIGGSVKIDELILDQVGKVSIVGNSEVGKARLTECYLVSRADRAEFRVLELDETRCEKYCLTRLRPRTLKIDAYTKRYLYEELKEGKELEKRYEKVISGSREKIERIENRRESVGSDESIMYIIE